MSFREKFIIIEPRDNVRELISFYVEFKFNLEPMKHKSFNNKIEDVIRDGVRLIIRGDISSEENQKLNQALKSCAEIKVFTIEEVIALLETITPSKKKNFKLKLINTDLANLLVPIIPKDKPDYSAVPLEVLPHFSRMGSDLYVKLNSGRLIKIFNNDDRIEHSDIERFSSRGIQNLFLKTNAHSNLIEAISGSYENILNNPKHIIPINYCDNLEQLQIAPEFLRETLDKVKQVKSDIYKANNLRSFLEAGKVNRTVERYVETRTQLVSVICCWMAKELSWGSEKTYHDLVLAAHLHDLLLLRNPTLAAIKTEKDFNKMKPLFNKEDQDLFFGHPEMTAKLLEGETIVSPEVISIIRQHHECPTGEGFPLKLTHESIRSYSALFNLSLELSDFILKNPKWTLADFFQINKKECLGPIYNRIFRQLSDHKSLSYHKESRGHEGFN